MPVTKKQLVAVASALQEKGFYDFGKRNPRLLSVTELTDAVLQASRAKGIRKALGKASLIVFDAVIKEAKQKEVDEALEKTDRELLEVACLELNKVMGLDPGIDINLPDAELLERLKVAAGLIMDGDTFSNTTLAVLDAHGLRGNAKAVTRPVGCTATKQEQPKLEKGMGVVSTIQEFVVDVFKSDSEDKEIHIPELLAKLVETFPKRPVFSMMNTIISQIPGKLTKDKGFIFEKNAVGNYCIRCIGNGE